MADLNWGNPRILAQAKHFLDGREEHTTTIDGNAVKVTLSGSGNDLRLKIFREVPGDLHYFEFKGLQAEFVGSMQHKAGLRQISEVHALMEKLAGDDDLLPLPLEAKFGCLRPFGPYNGPENH